MTMWSISDKMLISLPQYTSKNVELIKSSRYMADIHKTALCTPYGLPLNGDLVFELCTCSRGMHVGQPSLTMYFCFIMKVHVFVVMFCI